MRRIAGFAALLIAVTLWLSGCSRPAETQGTDTATGGNPWERTALWVDLGDRTTPFANGSTLPVGDLNLEIFVAPFPPLREGSIDLYLTDRATGRPAEAGALKITFDMFMPHGVIRAQALPTGGGHFLVPYRLVMPGEWRLDITIAHRNDVIALALIFKVQ